MRRNWSGFLVLGEEQVCEKSNEVTAIPLLLESLTLKDATVSVDAAGCQKDMALLTKYFKHIEASESAKREERCI